MKRKVILIAGPTASGKSSLALRLARKLDGIIINADALQVYQNWQVLTARPSEAELQQAPHFLYGHIHKTGSYSVGHWIKEVSELLDKNSKTTVIAGGTGLYFRALTEGLSEIPAIAAELRKRGDEYRLAHGASWFCEQLLLKDPESLATLDQNNPMRLQRAWEVLEATGKGMAYWHARPARPLVSLENTSALVLNWPVETLNQRIDQRFDRMMKTGAIEECEAARRDGFDPKLPANRALGAQEIIGALNGKITMQEAVIKSKIATHQFAKRQRTWFRNKMNNWRQVDMTDTQSVENLMDEITIDQS